MAKPGEGRHRWWWATALLLLGALACALPTVSTPTPAADLLPVPGATPTPLPFAGTAAIAGGGQGIGPNPFAPYVLGDELDLSPAAAPALSAENVVKSDALQALSPAQQTDLLEQGFVVVAQPYGSFLDVFVAAQERKLPLFVSSDVLIHATHGVTKVAWRHVQRDYLVDDLAAFSEAMVRATEEQWQSIGDEALSAASWRNLAFFSVGTRLLAPSFPVPEAVAEVVAEELTLIDQGGDFISPLFGSQLAYGQFRPSPTIAGDEEMSAYYQAFVWFTQPFSLETETVDSARAAARQLLLMWQAAQTSDNLSRWARLYDPSSYFQGGDGAWGLRQIETAALAVYGNGTGAERFAPSDLLDDFIATVLVQPRPVVLNPEPAERFRLLPAPTAADDAILRALIFNRVGLYQGNPEQLPDTAVTTEVGVIRGLPRAIDVAAVLGSEPALTWINGDGDADYQGYTGQMNELRGYVDDLDVAAWAQTAGGAWLFSLQPLLSADGEPRSVPFLGPGWREKSFNTWYGAWVELRDEPVLAPQSVARAGQETEVASGYVEPAPVLYGRVAATVGQMIDGLDSRGLLGKEDGEKLRALQRLLVVMQEISRKELGQEPLTQDEAQTIAQMGERLAALTTFSAPDGTSAPQADGSLPRIVDVYVDPGSGRGLQAAIGEAWLVYVIVPGGERPYLTLGPLFTTYELLLQPGERLTLSAWRGLDDRPAPPRWLETMVVP